MQVVKVLASWVDSEATSNRRVDLAELADGYLLVGVAAAGLIGVRGRRRVRGRLVFTLRFRSSA